MHGGIKVEELPAVENMASVLHQGTARTLGHAYAALRTWIGANAYVQCGPYREVLVQAGSTADDPATVIELQVPVVPDARLAPVLSG